MDSLLRMIIMTTINSPKRPYRHLRMDHVGVRSHSPLEDPRCQVNQDIDQRVQFLMGQDTLDSLVHHRVVPSPSLIEFKCSNLLRKCTSTELISLIPSSQEVQDSMLTKS